MNLIFIKLLFGLGVVLSLCSCRNMNDVKFNESRWNISILIESDAKESHWKQISEFDRYRMCMDMLREDWGYQVMDSKRLPGIRCADFYLNGSDGKTWILVLWNNYDSFVRISENNARMADPPIPFAIIHTEKFIYYNPGQAKF